MPRGRSIHRALRQTEVSVSAQDLEHGKCIVCGKWLPSDCHDYRKYCSAKCVAKLNRTINPGPGWRRKISEKQKLEMAELRRQGMTHKNIAAKFNISIKSVDAILNGHLRR
jgi:hypothetical protein